MKGVDVRREHDHDRRDAGQRLDALDHIAGVELLHELFEEAKGELFAGGVGHDEGAAFGLGDVGDFAGQLRFDFRLREVSGKFAPKRNVGGLRQLEDFAGKNALRDKPGLFSERELGRVEPFHETREHLFHQACARPELFRETILDEAREGVVETVRERERRPARAVRKAAASTDVFEKFVRRLGERRFCEGRSDKDAAVIIGAADEDFFPGLGMSRRKMVTLRKGVDLFPSEMREDVSGEIAEERVAQTIDAFEVLEEQNESLEMRGAQLAVDAVKRVRDGVRDRLLLQESLQIKNVVAQADDLVVLRLRKAPDKQVILQGSCGK